MDSMRDLRLSHARAAATLVDMQTQTLQVTVLGLGRMGTAMAARLAGPSGQYDVRTWTRSAGGSPADVVAGSDLVLLCLYDGPACRSVLDSCVGSLSAGTTVVNTTTVAPDEATDLAYVVDGSGATYLHA